jgi:hypothetical protein
MASSIERTQIVAALTTRMRQKMNLTLKNITRAGDRYNNIPTISADVKAAKMGIAKVTNYRNTMADGIKELDEIQSEWTNLASNHPSPETSIDLMGALGEYNGESGGKFTSIYNTSLNVLAGIDRKSTRLNSSH